MFYYSRCTSKYVIDKNNKFTPVVSRRESKNNLIPTSRTKNIYKDYPILIKKYFHGKLSKRSRSNFQKKETLSVCIQMLLWNSWDSMASFGLELTDWLTDRWMDGLTDGRTDGLTDEWAKMKHLTNEWARLESPKLLKPCFFVFRVLAALGCLHLDVLSILLIQHPVPKRKKTNACLKWRHVMVMSAYFPETIRFDGITYQLVGKDYESTWREDGPLV